jgi:hypothetical protein
MLASVKAGNSPAKQCAMTAALTIHQANPLGEDCESERRERELNES